MKRTFSTYCTVIVLFFVCISCGQSPQKEEKQAILSALKTTDRISSNHYSEIVKDSLGNSYIACFEKKEDQQDYILITKVDPAGNIVWELGNHNRGRATAISINERKNILVAGWFKTNLQFGEQSIINKLNGQSFIAEITPEGKCIALKANNSDGIFNIHSNASGERLVSGVMSGTLSFDTVSYTLEANEQANFMAYFDADGLCQWIRKFDAKLFRIKSHQNDFYLTGRFNNQFAFGGDTLKNGGVYDNDGFLLKIKQHGEAGWNRAFGTKGLMDSVYHTEETGCDMAFDAEGNVLVCALIHESPEISISDVMIRKYSAKGDFLNEKRIVKKANNTVFTFTEGNHNNYWLTGSVKNTLLLDDSSWKTFSPVNAFILKLDAQLKCEEVILPKHGPNTLFRSAYFSNNYMSFTGHFKTLFTYEKDSISNSGKNALFIYSLPVD